MEKESKMAWEEMHRREVAEAKAKAEAEELAEAEEFEAARENRERERAEQEPDAKRKRDMKLAYERHKQEELAKAAAQNAIEKLEWEKQRRLQNEIEATQAAVKEKAR